MCNDSPSDDPVCLAHQSCFQHAEMICHDADLTPRDACFLDRCVDVERGSAIKTCHHGGNWMPVEIFVGTLILIYLAV